MGGHRERTNLFGRIAKKLITGLAVSLVIYWFFSSRLVRVVSVSFYSVSYFTYFILYGLTMTKNRGSLRLYFYIDDIYIIT